MVEGLKPPEEELKARDFFLNLVEGGGDPLVAIEELLYNDSPYESWEEWAMRLERNKE